MPEPHAKPTAPPDDELDELPPMDGEDGDEEAAPEELDDEPASDGTDPFDDATSEGDPIDDELQVGAEDEGWLDDDEGEPVDVGDPELEVGDEAEGFLDAGDEPGISDDDLTAGADDGPPMADAGEEGFDRDDEELREDDLPRLDAGDDDEGGEEDLEGEAWPLDDDPREEPRPPWDDRAWERAGAPLALAAGAVDGVACAGRGVLVVGRGVARVDLEGSVEPLEALGLRGGAVIAIAVDGPHVALATSRAGVLVSHDGGSSFDDANGWRPLVPRADADAPLVVVASAGDLFGRTRGGVLVRSADYGVSWAVVPSARRVEAITVDSAGGLVSLARDGASLFVAHGGAALEWTALPPLADVATAASLGVIARGAHLAVVAPGRGVFRAASGGWGRVEGTASVTACAFSRADGTLLVAVYSGVEDRAWILEARGPDAAPRVIAEVGETSPSDDGDARVRCLVWDEAHGVAWAAGGFGLVALHPVALPRAPAA